MLCGLGNGSQASIFNTVRKKSQLIKWQEIDIARTQTTPIFLISALKQTDDIMEYIIKRRCRSLINSTDQTIAKNRLVTVVSYQCLFTWSTHSFIPQLYRSQDGAVLGHDSHRIIFVLCKIKNTIRSSRCTPVQKVQYIHFISNYATGNIHHKL